MDSPGWVPTYYSVAPGKAAERRGVSGGPVWVDPFHSRLGFLTKEANWVFVNRDHGVS